jgi:mannose-6-phosphate isomerase-like protein (cupin superfamily)/glycerol-3-phosphate cytidylyltransferase-like family protein
VVGVNSDSWLQRKKGREFMPSYERVQIIENLKMVDHCILFNDAEDHAIEAIRNVKIMYPNSQIVFANGGDRTEQNIPEMTEPDVEFRFEVGGTIKKNSSSWILEEWKAPKTARPWGYYRVLHEVPGTKVKELTIEPGQSLTMQRHYDRDEHWHVSEGRCHVDFEDATTESHVKLKIHDQFTIRAETWHKLSNPYDVPCKIVEIQYGISCDEDDIERR